MIALVYYIAAVGMHGKCAFSTHAFSRLCCPTNESIHSPVLNASCRGLSVAVHWVPDCRFHFALISGLYVYLESQTDATPKQRVLSHRCSDMQSLPCDKPAHLLGAKDITVAQY